jgi:ferredoxin
MGCGSCIVGCEQKAITFDLVRPPEHIPERTAREWPAKIADEIGVSFVREEFLK